MNTEVARIVDAGYEEVFERGATKMGYRFCVDEAIFPEGISAGTTFSTKIKLSNSGVGRFSLPGYHFGLMLLDESGKIVDTQLEKNFDLRQLLNGETVNLFLDFDCKSNLKEGEYTLASFIANQDGEPAIRLGQVGNYDQMIYPLGKIKVGAYETPSEMLYEEVEQLADLELKPSTQYELTFDYVPSVNLKTDYKMGDSHGFEVQLSDGQETITVCNWQDVSETLTTKTVTFATPDSSKYRVNILGTGVYQGKIQVSNMKVNSYKGNMEDFAQRRTHSWSVGNDTTYEIFKDGNEFINSSNVIYLESNTLHEKLDTLIYDASLKNNAAYTIHFDFKGATATSGTYYYVRLVDENNQEVQSIGEWYDRNDMNSSNKTFTFVTPEDGKNLKLAIGVKNSGAFYLDNIHLVELAKGNIVRGPEVESAHNERVYDAKKGLNYVEGFENRVLNDSTFTYGFNRWGHLTRDIREVISGNYSMSSDIDDTTFHYQDRNDFYEFCYSNPKYIKLKPNTTYHLEFKYKKMSNIQLVSDPHLAGNGYVFLRSLSNPSAASPTMDFATSLDALEEVYTFQGDFVCPNEEDCYFILSLLGRGNVIIDDISIGEK